MKKNNDKIKSGWSNELIPQLYELEDKIPISHIILGVVGIAGVMSIALLAPNAVQILRLIRPKDWKKLNNPRYRVNETLRRLIKEGVVVLDQKNDEPPVVQLTAKGKQRFRKLQLKTNNRAKEQWDGKWRVVVFDVLEKKRKIRDYLRIGLHDIGFNKLQNSVWVYPYECEEMIALLKVDLKLGSDVLYFVVDKLEGDDKLRILFSLPKRTT